VRHTKAVWRELFGSSASRSPTTTVLLNADDLLPLHVGPLDDPEEWIDAVVTGTREFWTTVRSTGRRRRFVVTFTKFRHAPDPARPDEAKEVAVSYTTSDPEVYPEGGVAPLSSRVLVRDIKEFPGGWRAMHARTKRLGECLD
jgi:hypothetical protein